MTADHGGTGQASGGHGPAAAPVPLDPADPTLTRMDLVREGARLDDVELVHYQPRFPVPGTALERRVERRAALLFFLAFVGGIGFVAVLIFWPWQFSLTGGAWALFTPLLGVAMALALFGVGAGLIYYAKNLLPEEEAVQLRHPNDSSAIDKATTAAILAEGLESSGLGRRSLIKRTLGLTGLGLGAMAVAAPLAGLIKKPGKALFETPWRNGVRLVRDDGSPIKPSDISPGSFETVFPGVKGGNRASDAATLLIHLRPTEHPVIKPGREGWNYGNFFAYSKICTHAGCPVGLYEQQDNRLLCPCHQSQFNVLDGCRPIFGPATRSLPQLRIALDDQGYFIAKGDYTEAVGPAFWERP